MNSRRLKVILSGGGTGGHIYPAVAVAEALKRKLGDGVDLLFVGAEGKMEMEKIPSLGYRIEGLPIAGLQRRMDLHNLLVPIKIVRSISQARNLLRRENADMAIGFGGYASAPLLWTAQRLGIPTMIQEQNSFAGLSNKLLSKRAARICVAYDRMERYFSKEKILMTGNPLRGNFNAPVNRKEAFDYFGLREDKPTLLVVGGSLGTRTFNEMMKHWVDRIIERDEVQVIWQNGKYYDSEMNTFMSSRTAPNIWRGAFINRMDYAYAAADVVVSRSGACSVSELCLLGKPTVFVPSPNVAEDHQTKNAMALVEKDAALMIRDCEAKENVIPEAMKLLADKERCAVLSKNIRSLAIADSADRIVRAALEIISEHKQIREMKNNIYFIGIGGIGMSAIARYFMHEGRNVGGYDRVRSPLCERLESEGADIHYEDSVEKIASNFRNPDDTLVVYTPAIPNDHSELRFFVDGGYEVVKRSAMLGHLSEGKFVMAVAGTHGKTTTTTLTAWINHMSRDGGSAFLGGISKNFDSNLVLGKGNRFAVEADEFDRSFLQLYPNIAVVTAADADHLDIYGTHKAVKRAFAQFIRQIKPGGALIIKQGVDVEINNPDIRVFRYSCDDEAADFKARNIELCDDGCYRFDLACPDTVIEGCKLGVVGKINVENAVAASAMTLLAGVEPQQIKEALASFKGVKRRFECYVNTPKKVYIDDYAHHPEELRAAITSIREMFPNRRLTAIFQPHLYTRTRDFYKEFARSLSIADEVILLPIYPAREEPIEGISSQIIADNMTVPYRQVPKEVVARMVSDANVDVVVSFGAGDIDNYCQAIADSVEKQV